MQADLRHLQLLLSAAIERGDAFAVGLCELTLCYGQALAKERASRVRLLLSVLQPEGIDGSE